MKMGAFFAKDDDLDHEREFGRAMVERAGSSVFSQSIALSILAYASYMSAFAADMAIVIIVRILALANGYLNIAVLRRAIANKGGDLKRAIARFHYGMVIAGGTWALPIVVIPSDQFASIAGGMILSLVTAGFTVTTIANSPRPQTMIGFAASFFAVGLIGLVGATPEVGIFPIIVHTLIFVAILGMGVGFSLQSRQAARSIVQNQRLAEALQKTNDELARALGSAGRLARYDQLTGIANRRQFDERTAEIAAARKAEHRWHILLLDLDHFKRINDLCGHQSGDAVLREAGGILSEVADGLPVGTLVARLGGEEFAMLVPALGDEGAQGLATLIRDRFRHITPPREYDRAVTISVGISSWFSDETISPALGRADKALYEAKEGGRDRVAMADHKRAA